MVRNNTVLFSTRRGRRVRCAECHLGYLCCCWVISSVEVQCIWDSVTWFVVKEAQVLHDEMRSPSSASVEHGDEPGVLCVCCLGRTLICVKSAVKPRPTNQPSVEHSDEPGVLNVCCLGRTLIWVKSAVKPRPTKQPTLGRTQWWTRCVECLLPR